MTSSSICIVNDMLQVRLLVSRCLCFAFKTRPTRNEKEIRLLHHSTTLNQGQLVGGDVEGIDIGRQAGVGLLGAVGAATHSVSTCKENA